MADEAVTAEDVVLIERTTPQEFRDWQLALIGGTRALSPSFLAKLPSPEDEIRSLLDRMLPGDELWRCRSRVFAPNALIGSQGLAVVRNGAPIIYRAMVHH